jgi:hypothetical protein
MPMQRMLAALAVGSIAAVTAVTTGTEKQIPISIANLADMGIPLPMPGLEGRHLRGPPAGLDEFPMGAIRMDALPMDELPMGAIPMGAIPMDAIRMDELPEGVEIEQGRPIAEGSLSPGLRDLLDFGSAMGAAVLRPGGLEAIPMPVQRALEARRGLDGIGGEMGGALELPLGALHLKLQEHVPKPLHVEDGKEKLRIYGTLPQHLTSKTLKVSLSGSEGRNLRVQYFLGQGAGAKNAVGIDEKFALDFAPAGMPAVTYKASTGAFELSLSRPAAKPQEQVAIDFDSSPSTGAVAKVTAAAVIPGKASAVKVALERKPKAAHSRQHQASPKEFVHESKMKRLLASSALKENRGEMAKVTKALHQVAQKQGLGEDEDAKAARVKDISARVKSVVANAQLFDAQNALKDAFAPFDYSGLVMLEMSHQVRAH